MEAEAESRKEETQMANQPKRMIDGEGRTTTANPPPVFIPISPSYPPIPYQKNVLTRVDVVRYAVAAIVLGLCMAGAATGRGAPPAPSSTPEAPAKVDVKPVVKDEQIKGRLAKI